MISMIIRLTVGRWDIHHCWSLGGCLAGTCSRHWTNYDEDDGDDDDVDDDEDDDDDNDGDDDDDDEVT